MQQITLPEAAVNNALHSVTLNAQDTVSGELGLSMAYAITVGKDLARITELGTTKSPENNTPLFVVGYKFQGSPWPKT